MIQLEQDQKEPPRNIPRTRRVSYRTYNTENMAPHPYIRLGGKYLEAYGFKIGDSIELKLQPGCLTIIKSKVSSRE